MAGETRRRRLRALLTLAGVRDQPLAAFEQAFAHASAVAEGSVPPPSNERLEFLGDAVLGYATAQYLFHQHPDAPEGELAKRKAALASDAAIATTAKRLSFEELLVLGNGERATGGATRPSNLGDAFEAFLAALSLTCGMATAVAFVEREHLQQQTTLDHLGQDAKTALQEFTQAHFRQAPSYHDAGDEGPAHAPRFRASVSLNGTVLAWGSGPSKKAAQQAAAAAALVELQPQA